MRGRSYEHGTSESMRGWVDVDVNERSPTVVIHPYMSSTLVFVAFPLDRGEKETKTGEIKLNEECGETGFTCSVRVG